MTHLDTGVIMRPVQKIELQKGGRKTIMAFNYDKLRGKIIEKYGSQYRFAEAMEWSERTLSLKMNNSRAWKQTDIQKAIMLLNISERDIPLYFFTPEVQNIEL